MSVIYVALFAAYMFLHTTTLHLGSHGGTALLSTMEQARLYYVHQIFIVLGFLSFSAMRRFLTARQSQRVLTVASMSVYLLGTVTLFSAQTAFTYRYIASATIFCLGYLGGLVYWRMAVSLRESRRMGLIMGVGCAVAYALQFPLQLWRGVSPLLPVVMLVAFVTLAYLLFSEDVPDNGSSERPDATQGRTLTISLLCACVVTTALVVLVNYYDGYIERMQVSTGYGAYNAFSWPRLLLVPCYLLFGRLGDVKGGKYSPLSACCPILATLLIPVLVNSGDAYWLNMCLFYIAIAAMITYYNLTFWRLAPKTRRSSLWASMGRVIDGAVGVTLGLSSFSASSIAVVTLVEVVSLTVLAIALSLDMYSGLPSTLRAVPVFSGEGTVPPVYADSVMEVIRKTCDLSERESEVLREWLNTEDTQKAIAQRLFISPNTLRKHINAVYTKTDRHSRDALRALADETLRSQP